MKKFNTSHKTVRIVFKYLRGFCSKSENQIKNSQKRKSRIWFPDMQFIHRKLQNPQGSGRSSDLLRWFQRLPVRFGMDSGIRLKLLKSLQQREL
jgi:hypothetical protein